MRLHPGADPACKLCKGAGYDVAQGVIFAEAALCSCVQPCPDCRGTGFVALSDDFRARRRRCACQILERRIHIFNHAHIPGRHANSTLKSYKPSKERMAWYLPVSQYVRDFAPKSQNRGMVLHGEVGRGKTHLMVAVLRELVFRYGVTVRFTEFSHLLADLKSGFDRGEGPARLLDPLANVQVLAIDELGKGRGTEFEGTIVDELVSRRYNTASTILGTTNYPPFAAPRPKRPPTGFTTEAHTLEDRVGARVFSRLLEMSDFIAVGGADYRALRHFDGRATISDSL